MFMSCRSITPMGIIEGDPLIARADAKLLTLAERLIVIADPCKSQPRGIMEVGTLARVHTPIADGHAPEQFLDHATSLGIHTMRAEGGRNSISSAA
jgi:DeoR family transcriptional regulator, ulaG and ulaABCDEF operon transcriptional repressor